MRRMSQASDRKTLILVRHAKATQDVVASDHERELVTRGRRDARAAGAWLRQQQLMPEIAIVSTAARAQQTWDGMVAGGCSAEFVEQVRTIYSAGAEGVLHVVSADAGDASSVLVVGHNPTVAELASRLSDGEGDDDAHERLCHGVPTCGIAVLAYAGRWSDLGFGTCSLEAFHVARAPQAQVV